MHTAAEVAEIFRCHNESERKSAIADYYNNPNRCLYCKSVISIKEGQKIGSVRKKKFCNSSCFGFYTNKVSFRPSRKKERLCIACNKPHKSKGRFCTDCYLIVRRKGRPPLRERSKGALFSSHKNWQSARTRIRNDANLTFKNSGQEYKCRICGYEKHVEICHKRAVSDFPDSAKVYEINDLDNLVPLCPTHHWEQENNALDPDEQELMAGHLGSGKENRTPVKSLSG